MALLDSGCLNLWFILLLYQETFGLKLLPIFVVFMVRRVYPIAEVYITVDGQTYLMSIALGTKLPYSVISSSDVPVLFDLIQQAQTKAHLDGENSLTLPVHQEKCS